MCGIVGVYGREQYHSDIEQALEVLKERGKDGRGRIGHIGHTLHAIVAIVKQPMKKKGIFAANCEIYNWKELCEKHKKKCKNDSELLFEMLEESNDISKVMDQLDGVYAFCYERDKKVMLARDIIGIKPIWYSHNQGFGFASEKKALEKIGFSDIRELSPREILIYDIKKDKIEFKRRRFFETKKIGLDYQEKTKKLLVEAVKKRIPDQKFGLLFSGGVDSTILALILKNLGHEFTCYTSVIEDSALREPEDLRFAKIATEELDLKLKVIRIKTEDVAKNLKKLVPLIEDSNVVKAGVGLTFYAACEQAKKDGCKVIFSGLGSEEIFAGYHRHRNSLDINKECVSGLLKMHERDTYRDDVITMKHNLELRVPFLDKKLVSYALNIPEEEKISEKHSKVILRKVAEEMGLSEKLAWRPKKAAQYGSNFDKAIGKLTRKAGLKYKSEYLRQFYPKHNLRLGALVSSGKDGLYAGYVMMRQNYSVECFITINSENQDSYMFHTPNVHLVKLQSEAVGIPLIEGSTAGEKETELADLEKILNQAKKKYKLDGIVTGALYSTYQRDRIEKICDSLGLKIFSPLWHINQETEMREIIKEGFKFVFSMVGAEGFDRAWLGREITEKDVDRLVSMNEKVGLNIAGEGGEFESLVLDGPIFKKKIEIEESEINMENNYLGRFNIKKARLVEK